MPDGDAARKAGGRVGCGSVRCLSRSLALVLVADGLITVAWGRGFLIRQRRLAPDWYKSVLDWLLGWPEPLLRLGAAIEAALGGLLLWPTERQMEKLTKWSVSGLLVATGFSDRARRIL